MGLETYRQKRDFSRTPEPSGAAGRAGGPAAEGAAAEVRLFTVQKHDASRLHYDFRLELGGVLKSWAVPKGPNLDPSVRRLAVHVEDHPLEYADFEGVIPEEEYGGGTVLLWDLGIWRPKGDPVAGYKKGHIELRLKGEKLRGRWHLVRTGSNGKRDRSEDGGSGESWLLIKASDKEARPGNGAAILDERPESVITGRGLAEIARDRDRVWTSGGEISSDEGGPTRGAAAARAKALAGLADPPDPADIEEAREAPLPDAPKPQLATLVSEPPAGDEWVHEIKYDGYRILCRVEDGEARLITRSGQNWTQRYPRVARAAASLPAADALLDGEVVVLDAEGRSDFQALQNVRGGPTPNLFYMAFDLLHLEGFDLTPAPLLKRKEALESLLTASTDATRAILYGGHVAGDGKHFYEETCRLGVEGMVSKRAGAPYGAGRRGDWLKIRCTLRQEFVVVGFTEPSGSRKGLGALLLGVHENGGDLVYAGKVGTGFTTRFLPKLRRRLEPSVRKKPPVKEAPREIRARDVHWVDPELVAEVEFAGWTETGRLRHPSFQGLRDDRDPRDVVREEPAPAPETTTAAAEDPTAAAGDPAGMAASVPSSTRGTARTESRSEARTESRTGGRKNGGPLRIAGIRITNPDRVLYAEHGYTKATIARYYGEVADAMLPHVAGRPLTLVRCPSGLHEDCFYQKHAGDSVPKIVGRVPIEEEEGETEDYMEIDSVPALVALAQLGTLEFHVWGARSDRPERPDRLIFDLDPGPGVEWSEISSAALLLRDFLGELGLKSFVKTTGGKGLHVVAPLVRRSSWEEVKSFARAVAEAPAAVAPDRFTTTVSKSARPGKIYIDYLRNGAGATAVAAYSTRAREGAPVSVPLAWDEMEETDKMPVFTVENVPARVSSLERGPWDGFDDVRQSITKDMRERLGMGD